MQKFSIWRQTLKITRHRGDVRVFASPLVVRNHENELFLSFTSYSIILSLLRRSSSQKNSHQRCNHSPEICSVLCVPGVGGKVWDMRDFLGGNHPYFLIEHAQVLPARFIVEIQACGEWEQCCCYIFGRKVSWCLQCVVCVCARCGWKVLRFSWIFQFLPRGVEIHDTWNVRV